MSVNLDSLPCHLDRDTGKLQNDFRPRFSARAPR
jgi:hypothetical protein